jgi:uncharacterized protein (DUF3084 family)
MTAAVYIVLLLVGLVACAVGAVAAYFYFRARHREAILELDALDQDVRERQEEIRRLQYKLAPSLSRNTPTIGSTSDDELEMLREQFEQQRIEYNILKQDFDLETNILRQEIEQFRAEKSDVERLRRHLAQKETELEEQAEELVQRRVAIDEDRKRLEAQRARSIREVQAQRAKQTAAVRARLKALKDRRAALDEREARIQAAEREIDETLFNLPADRFTSRGEAILIKRLRRQIKLQRDELERLHFEYRRSLAREPGGAATAEDAARSAPRNAGAESGDERPAYSSLSALSGTKDDARESDP